MTEHGLIDDEIVVLQETPEQAARSISIALDFLRREADAIGLLDVGDLIGRARAKASERYPDSKTEPAAG